MTAKLNLQQFLSKFRANQQLALSASAKATNKTIRDMYGLIVERTPVGNPTLWNYPAPANYEPGTLRASWRIDYDGVLRNAKGQFESASNVLSGGGLSFKIGRNNKKEAAISNNQPYAQRVEEGWSTQAPQGMMRITIAQYSVLMNKNAALFKVR